VVSDLNGTQSVNLWFSAADVRVFVRYVSQAIAGYNAAVADDTSSPRACMDDCVVNKVQSM
jgi:3D (Asp-Asp-Asp) domain-containing protein